MTSPDGAGAPCAGCGVADQALWADSLWWLSPMAGPAGWVVLWARRHVATVDQLDAEELGSLGPTLARVSTAVRRAVAAERVYLEVQGERVPHFHVMLLARGESVPAQLRGPRLLASAQELGEREAPGAREAAARQISTVLGARPHEALEGVR